VPDRKLVAVRTALLELHRVLVNHERLAYERLYGRFSAAEFLRRVTNENLLQWLAPMSEMIVHIDEHLEGKEETPLPSSEWISAVQDLIKVNPTDTPFRQRYAALLQEADVLFAHGEVVRALSAPDVTH
jgi:hypothetical protein